MHYPPFFRLYVCLMGLAFVLLAIRPPVAPAGRLVRMEKVQDAADDASMPDEDDLSGVQIVEEEQHLAVKSPTDAWSIPSKECALPTDCLVRSPLALVLESLPMPPDWA